MFCGYDEEKVYTYIFYRDTVIGETVESSFKRLHELGKGKNQILLSVISLLFFHKKLY